MWAISYGSSTIAFDNHNALKTKRAEEYLSTIWGHKLSKVIIPLVICYRPLTEKVKIFQSSGTLNTLTSISGTKLNLHWQSGLLLASTLLKELTSSIGLKLYSQYHQFHSVKIVKTCVKTCVVEDCELQLKYLYSSTQVFEKKKKKI